MCTASACSALAGAREPPKPVDPITAVKLGAEETWFVVERTMSYLEGVIIGRESADQLGGPIRIAQVSGQVATAGMVALIHLAAVLSVSIGLLNLFPIPLLDGGHLLFYAIEAVRGRPLSERAQEMGFRIGLASGADADDLRDLQRHHHLWPCHARERTWPSGNALTTKGDPAESKVCRGTETRYKASLGGHKFRPIRC